MSIKIADKRKKLGAFGELFAADYIELCLGWTICARNWRCRRGEIDLVAVDRDTLVIIEVRTRSGSQNYGSPLDSIDLYKQRQLVRMGKLFLAQAPWNENTDYIRIDVIALQVQNHLVTEIQHFRNIIEFDF